MLNYCVLLVAPGAFNVNNVTFVSSTVVNITIEEVSVCTYIHSTSVPLSVTHMFLYLQMQLNVNSGRNMVCVAMGTCYLSHFLSSGITRLRFVPNTLVLHHH